MSAIQGSGLEAGVPAIQGSALEGARGVCNSGVWIRGVSTIQGSGLEGYPLFRGLH